ncbi:MAG: adenylosuccinate synthetase, partial [Candidatus Aenigmarchaeota archaeon]|nr:adenylosuccinate synthetase [Candidatus Aenigmarchaeota archaeon]MDI6722591.1 adenylosuccinate synthetase [Candidatus Aenigmarchaeota archaeon]
GNLMRDRGNEFGATTGRPRRCGWFDALVSRYSFQVNGFDSIAVMKLDVLDHFHEIPLCNAYEIDGKETSTFPSHYSELEKAKPVYEMADGWAEPTRGVTEWNKLPDNAKRYLDYLQDASGVKIDFISTGPEKDELIEVNGV